LIRLILFPDIVYHLGAAEELDGHGGARLDAAQPNHLLLDLINRSWLSLSREMTRVLVA